MINMITFIEVENEEDEYMFESVNTWSYRGYTNNDNTIKRGIRQNFKVDVINDKISRNSKSSN